MIYVLLSLLIILALCVLREPRNFGVIIFMGIFSLLASMSFFILGAPDVAMAEAAIGAFTTIFFVICFEKYDDLKVDQKLTQKKSRKKRVSDLRKFIAPLGFSALLFILFIHFSPEGEANAFLRNQYLLYFMYDVGGENAVTAIYLGYRVYDTLFEALVLIASVIAVGHMSYFSGMASKDGERSGVERSIVVQAVMHIIPVVILLFGVYLILNGHMTAGGGFQGGLFIAAFFVCRYLSYGIFDLPVGRIFRMEEFVFSFTVLLVIFVIFLGASAYLPPIFQNIYMIVMNLLIGMKVACGFIILFYHYIAIERR